MGTCSADFNRSQITEVIEKSLTENPCKTEIRYDEPMSGHTTFKVGGSADCWLQPEGESFPLFCASLLHNAAAAGIPVFVLGGGANIVVSDKGIRGIVLDTGAWKGCSKDREELIVKSGTAMDEASEYTASVNLCGLEFLAGIPGSIGGGVYMNARCYGREIADVLKWTEVIDYSGEKPVIKKIETKPEDFGYKQSPFWGRKSFILSACFKLEQGVKKTIKSDMEKNRKDRTDKGHYLFPCAGSVFKNNQEYGKPAGQIIDELDLKGLSIGGAQVAPFHGNIIINKGGATASDIDALTKEIAVKVLARTGFLFVPEIIFAGEWPLEAKLPASDHLS